MQLADKVIIVTGGGNGIGRALCRRFAAEGAKAIVVADIDAAAARQVADEIRGEAMATDVSREDEVKRLVAQTIERHGAIDLFCSNAGIAITGDEQTSIDDWMRCWDVNVMAHVYAARAVLPSMFARGEGYLLQTVSAAGLLTHMQSATYAVTKHASLAFAEWLSVAYGDRGIKVSALCPQGVKTDMLFRSEDGLKNAKRAFLLDGALEPEQVADEVVKGIGDERFLILPHPEVAEYFRRKAGDYDRWLKGMRRLRKTEGQG
ncbi:MAG: SDR family oxidoreductase [Acidobacteriia bacterium]|nr:SDR family oxidoreductase [Terriglobia bacterium]